MVRSQTAASWCCPPTMSDSEAIAREVFGEGFSLARAYHDVLAGQGLEWGLIGPREVERLWDRHVLNSVSIADLIPVGADLVDVGSGAGLPGIPLAILRPDLRVTLLEPMLRRVNFLTQVVDNLGISDRVCVQRDRAEDYEGAFDVVTGRAVAPLRRFIPWVVPLFAQGGQLVALKGASAQEELADVDKLLKRMRLRAELLGVRAHPESEVTTAVRVRRV